ncbi:DNA primase [Haliangium sp.]|uniref:DNA primase n=1 Tax=Haliangium sp. TaxID=2663208 RepID=UPI003D0DC1C8
MGLIPEEVIHDIRDRADIVAVIGQYVSLRKAGRNHKGLCPFHHEKSPSFNVNPDKRFFYCFGCHKKGDVFTFVMEYEGKSFIEAAESLAARCGVTIPERQVSPAERRQRGERSRMLELNALAAEFFCTALRDPARGAPGRAYLAERGIDQATAEAFRLGYAPDEWHALAEFLEDHRIPAELACKVGLLVRQPRAGGVYDRFRGRLMCPVVLPGGEIAGFSGRILPAPAVDPTPGANDAAISNAGSKTDPAKQAAKYINSPESPVYKKSRLLFGIDRAREAFRRDRRALLVEGNFDVIHLHQAGFDSAVAPLGTALTSEQVGLLRRLVDEVVLLYDGDAAGQAASLKALEVLVEADVKVRIAALPSGQDPDTMIATGHGDQLTTLIERAQPGIEYFVYDVWSRSRHSADSHSEALNHAARLVAHVANPTKRDLITGTLASAMGLDPKLVQRAMGRASAHPRDRAAEVPPTARDHAAAPARPRQPPPREEVELIAILADHPELMEAAEARGVVSLLTDGRLRDMYCAARQGASMLSAAPEDIGPLITEHVLAGTYASVDDPAHCLEEAASRLERRRRRSQLEQLQQQARDARRRGDAARERQLVREILTIRRQVD